MKDIHTQILVLKFFGPILFCVIVFVLTFLFDFLYNFAFDLPWFAFASWFIRISLYFIDLLNILVFPAFYTRTFSIFCIMIFQLSQIA